jgi:hypothetical protein
MVMTISLDPIRDDLIAWAESLWLEDVGAFRNGNTTEAHIQSSLFMAYILYSMDAIEAIAFDRERWITWIQSQQNEQDGSFAFYDSEPPRRGIALWNVVRVLNILGGQVAHFPAYQQEAMTIDGLRAWFDGWKKRGDTHHEVLALVPTLVSHPDAHWVEAFFSELAEQQHPERGTWFKGDGEVNISRTFAYSLIHMGMDRLPPQPEKIVDAMLDLQEEDGFWHGGPNFSTMDAVYILARLPKNITWREAAAEAALHRVLDALIPYYEAYADREKSNTHQFAAIVQTFALLSEALPDRFETSWSWRFGWSNRAFWQCRVIKEGLVTVV